jgi:hypothetical protein
VDQQANPQVLIQSVLGIDRRLTIVVASGLEVFDKLYFLLDSQQVALARIQLVLGRGYPRRGIEGSCNHSLQNSFREKKLWEGLDRNSCFAGLQLLMLYCWPGLRIKLRSSYQEDGLIIIIHKTIHTQVDNIKKESNYLILFVGGLGRHITHCSLYNVGS